MPYHTISVHKQLPVLYTFSSIFYSFIWSKSLTCSFLVFHQSLVQFYTAFDLKHIHLRGILHISKPYNIHFRKYIHFLFWIPYTYTSNVCPIGFILYYNRSFPVWTDLQTYRGLWKYRYISSKYNLDIDIKIFIHKT